jgi:TolB-like protein
MSKISTIDITVLTKEAEIILSSSIFQQSPTLQKLLGFILKTAIEGNTITLKEYTIGVYALGKTPDFDPKKDPIVRIHMYRLRKALEQYYASEGSSRPNIISIPKGAYIPELIERHPGEQTEWAPTSMGHVRKRISVAVLPFTCSENDEDCSFFSDGLPDQLSTQLTRYSELSVISYFSCRQFSGSIKDIRQAGLLLDALYVLTGSMQTHGSTLRIRVQLTRSDSEEQIWAQEFESKRDTKNLFDIQDEMVWQVISRIAGHYGVISRNLSRLPPQKSPSDIGIFNAMFWYYHFVRDLSEDIFFKAENAMKTAVGFDPEYALAWAVLGEVLVGGFFMGYKSKTETHQLEAAFRFGKNAVNLDPDCQHGYQTMALAGIFNQQHGQSLQTIEAWQKITPPEPGIKGAMGFILICCGQYDRGHEMLIESIQLNPYYQWWFNAGLSFFYLHKKEYEQAIYWAEKMGQPAVAWEWIIKLTAYKALGNKTEYAAARQHLTLHFFYLEKTYDAYLHAFLGDKTLVNTFAQSLGAIFATKD